MSSYFLGNLRTYIVFWNSANCSGGQVEKTLRGYSGHGLLPIWLGNLQQVTNYLDLCVIFYNMRDELKMW